MTTKNKKSSAIKFLEKITGGPLTFSSMIRSIRLCDELTQEDFASLLGISKAHLCDIEKGRRSVTPVRAWAWGKKLGYSPEQFVELAIEASLQKDGLNFHVKLETA